MRSAGGMRLMLMTLGGLDFWFFLRLMREPSTAHAVTFGGMTLALVLIASPLWTRRKR